MNHNRIVNSLFIGVISFVLALAALSLLLNPGSTIKNKKVQDIDSIGVTQTSESFRSLTTVLPATATPENTPTATENPPTPTPTSEPLPDEAYIYGFIGHKQYYSIGCEANVAVDLAAYYDTYITQYDFQMNLPHSDNPDLGFVGDVNGPWGQIPPAAYGVHAAPIADLLNTYGVSVEGGKGYTLEQIKAALAKQDPVIVWVIGHMEYSDPVVYTDKLGNTTIVAPYEHVVVLTGYNATSVRYNNNGKYADVPIETFLQSWGVLGNMAVFHE